MITKSCNACKYSSRFVVPAGRGTKLNEEKTWKCEKECPEIKNPYAPNDCNFFEEKAFH